MKPILRPGIGKGWSKGTKLTYEHRAKIANAHKGKKHKPMSEQGRKNISLAGKGRKLTAEQRKAKSERLRGAKSHFWKGGISPINIRIRMSVEYRLWRESVFKRDNWTCVWCGVRSQKGVSVILNADHIKSFAAHPELRFAIDNGRTLCVPCHKTTDTYAKHKQI